jgi:hypothetical protein
MALLKLVEHLRQLRLHRRSQVQMPVALGGGSEKLHSGISGLSA